VSAAHFFMIGRYSDEGSDAWCPGPGGVARRRVDGGGGPDSEDFGIGAFLTKPLTDAISIYPSFGYWFAGEGVTSWELNADLIYKVPGESLEWLYVGAGLNYWKSSVDGCPANIDCSFSDVGLNLIGGFQPVSAGRIKPFAEARLYVGDGSGFSVAGGLRIPLGN